MNYLAKLSFAGVLLFGAFATAGAAGIDTKAVDLIKLDERWSKVAASRDAERVAAFYADDAIAYPNNEPVAVGREAAQQVWARYFADSTFTISWKTVHAGVSVSGDLGYTAGTYEDSFKGPDGKRVTEAGKYVCTWRRESNGEWKAIHDIWNTDAK